MLGINVLHRFILLMRFMCCKNRTRWSCALQIMVGLFPLKAEIVNMQLNYKNVSFFIYYIFVLIRVKAATMLKQDSEKESARILGKAINCIHSHIFFLTSKIWHSGSQIRLCRQRHASKQEDVGTVLSNYSLVCVHGVQLLTSHSAVAATERCIKACAMWILGVLGADFLSGRKPVGSSVVLLDGLGILQGWVSLF